MLLCFSVVLILLSNSSTAKPCAHITFPNLGSVVRAPENTIITLQFILVPLKCVVGDFKIRVGKRDKNELILGEYCRFVIENGICIQTFRNTGCECLPEKGMYLFNKTVDRHDNVTWIWWTETGVVGTKEIVFSIEYPANITDLAFTSEGQQIQNVLDQGLPLEITCFFDEGNPPVEVRLLGRHRTSVQDRNNTKRIRYRIPAVGCQDAGLIRCDAPGASHNKTASLLVKCPPEFANILDDRSIVQNNSLQVNFHIRAHVSEMNVCHLYRFPSASDDSNEIQMETVPKDCSGSISLTGTPPDLTLTVRLDDVRKEEEGEWRLELTNDAGTGYVHFYVNVTEGESPRAWLTMLNVTVSGNSSQPPVNAETTSSGVSKSGNHVTPVSEGPDLTLLGGISVGAFALIVITIIIVTGIRGMRTRNLIVVREDVGRPELELQNQRLSQSSSMSSHAADVYHEVDDASAEFRIPELEPPQPCHRARTLPSQPEDYLHPVASSAATEGTDSDNSVFHS